MAKSSVRGVGDFVEVRIVSQFNSHEILFEGKARMNDPVAVKQLFQEAALRGFNIDADKLF